MLHWSMQPQWPTGSPTGSVQPLPTRQHLLPSAVRPMHHLSARLLHRCDQQGALNRCHLRCTTRLLLPLPLQQVVTRPFASCLAARLLAALGDLALLLLTMSSHLSV